MFTHGFLDHDLASFKIDSIKTKKMMNILRDKIFLHQSCKGVNLAKWNTQSFIFTV